MKVLYFLTALALLLNSVTLGTGCHTSNVCGYQQNICVFFKDYFGLKYYKWCLKVVCEYCNLCGLCDGENQTQGTALLDRKKCIAEHNKFRRLHKNTPPLEWDDKIAKEAQTFAEHLANTINLEHGHVGENLFVKMGSNGTTVSTCKSASLAWYKEIEHFDYKTMKSTTNSSVEHFMQLVWKKTKRIGVGIAIHKRLKFVYLVARYDQPIMEGEERENVMPVY